MGFFSWLFGIPTKRENRMCRDKVRYKNYVAANQALDRINPGRRDHKKPIRYYKCPYCRGYHLTRSTK